MRVIGSGPKSFPHIAQQLLDRPLLIHPHKAEVLICALQQKLGIVSLDTIDGITLDAKAMVDRAALARDAVRDRATGKTFPVDGDIAVIHIDGVLVQKFGWLDPMCGFTGYDGLAIKLRDAMRDPDVYGIWLDIDSPGGSVAGLFAFVEELAASTMSEGGKPIYAWVNEMACSAAYAIASVCDKIYGPRDAMVGSIGAVIVHTEISAALAEGGAKVTIIRSGDRKYRGNAYEPLDDPTLEKWQKSVDDSRRRFAALVAAGRGIDARDVLATEADWFEGEDARKQGLIDALLPEREAWDRLVEECDTIKRNRRNGR